MTTFKANDLQYRLTISKQERRYLISLARQSDTYEASDVLALPKGAEQIFVKEAMKLIPKDQKIDFILKLLTEEQKEELKNKL